LSFFAKAISLVFNVQVGCALCIDRHAATTTTTMAAIRRPSVDYGDHQHFCLVSLLLLRAMSFHIILAEAENLNIFPISKRMQNTRNQNVDVKNGPTNNAPPWHISSYMYRRFGKLVLKSIS
jgi:hypothetical protein